jgi:hypothetical protein
MRSIALINKRGLKMLRFNQEAPVEFFDEQVNLERLVGFLLLAELGQPFLEPAEQHPSQPIDSKELAELRDPLKNKQAVENFFVQANGKGVLVSTCSFHPAGCHDFGTRLRARFGQLDYIGMDFTDSRYRETFTDPCSPQSVQNWESIFITGCKPKAWNDNVFKVVTHIETVYKPPRLKNIFVILPPHHSTSTCLNLFGTIKNSLRTKPYQVTVLTSGVDVDLPNSIGLANSVPVLDSKYAVEQTCFGLMYNRHPEFITRVDGDAYLTAYFSQVENAAGNSLDITVLAIGIKEVERVNAAAKEHGITVRHIDRLPQADFLQVIKTMAAKKGVISVDGPGALLQALVLGAPVLYYNTSNNEEFCKSLIQALPSNMQRIGEVMFGQSDMYHRLSDEKAVAEVFGRLRELIQRSSAVFENGLAKVRGQTEYKATLSVVSAPSDGDHKASVADNKEQVAVELTSTASMRQVLQIQQAQQAQQAPKASLKPLQIMTPPDEKQRPKPKKQIFMFNGFSTVMYTRSKPQQLQMLHEDLIADVIVRLIK